MYSKGNYRSKIGFIILHYYYYYINVYLPGSLEPETITTSIYLQIHMMDSFTFFLSVYYGKLKRLQMDIGRVKTVKVYLWLLAHSKLTYLGGGGWISKTKTGKTTCDSLVWTLYQPQGSAINDYADTSGMNILTLSMLRFF